MYIWWRLEYAKKGAIDLKKVEFDNDVNDDKIDDLEDESALYPNDGLANNNSNNIDHIGVINQHDEQQNHFVVPNNNLQPQNQHFGKLDQHDSDPNDDDGNNNGHTNLSEDDGSNIDNNSNGNDSDNSQNHGFDSYGNLTVNLRSTILMMIVNLIQMI